MVIFCSVTDPVNRQIAKWQPNEGLSETGRKSEFVGRSRMALEQCCSSLPSQWSSPPSLFSETAQVTLQIQQPPGRQSHKLARASSVGFPWDFDASLNTYSVRSAAKNGRLPATLISGR